MLDQRFEDARAHEQTEDFNRQEKILKLISTELSKNTTRVVEMAVKSEVQASVLPALENITKSQIRAVLNESVGQGLADLISQVCDAKVIYSIQDAHSLADITTRAREVASPFRYLESSGPSIVGECSTHDRTACQGCGE